MAEDNASAEDRTEDATPERREEFREKGNVVSSRELTSVIVLAACIAFLTYYGAHFLNDLTTLYVKHFERIRDFRVNPQNFFVYLRTVATDTVMLIAPIFVVSAAVAASSTFLQTRFNFSWQRVKPDFNRMNPLTGLARMVNFHALIELTKSSLKLIAVGFVTYLILRSEWIKVPALMTLTFEKSWDYWGQITKDLFWGVAMLMVGVAGADYAYNFFSLERKLRMTKQEVKEDYKRRESDPHIKNRMRRMQREFANRKVLEKTKDASVLITNPEHFAIAVKYELGMGAPIILAKGVDFLALRMREIAKEANIPIVENKPLARTLYKMVDEGQEIPESLYKAVSEVIRYVFKLKGINVNRKSPSNNQNNANLT